MSAKSAKTWRCFFCDEVFTRAIDAAEHFGATLGSTVACRIKGHEHSLLTLIREQEEQLASYRNDDGHIMRAMASLRSEHADALRRAEEDGYGRGVREMKALAEAQFNAPVLV